MALDLAFAETVRRRGILRTNILVMDEVIDVYDMCTICMCVGWYCMCVYAHILLALIIHIHAYIH